MGKPTNIYYYGARYYNPRWSSLSASGGWLSVDPLADKYPHASPYNYCLNNPVIFVDPDGREVFIYAGGKPILITAKDLASGTLNPVGLSGNDLKEFNTAYRALSSLYQTNNYAKNRLDFLIGHEHGIHINVKGSGDSHFSMSNKYEYASTVYWNPSMGVKDQYGTVVTNPVQALFHELTHAFDFLSNWVGIKVDVWGTIVDAFNHSKKENEHYAIFEGENKVGSTRKGSIESTDGTFNYSPIRSLELFHMEKMQTTKSTQNERDIISVTF